MSNWIFGRDYFHEMRIGIDEFPFLFTLQTSAGFCGFFFSVVWFALIASRYAAFWNSFTIVMAAVIMVSFVAMMMLSSLFTKNIVERNLYTDPRQRDWDLYARRSMTFTVVLFSIICSTLIWLTGGAWSPFIPFYIMVFTLALTRCQIPKPGRPLCLLFMTTLSIATIAAWKWLPPGVDHQTYSAIKQGDAKEYVDFAFALASMAVPYVSTWTAEKREARRKRGPMATPVKPENANSSAPASGPSQV
ncbi:hypothetical protein [Bradyrhizobium sp. CCGE-LA001]|uniref:hypothetical protein n=1 Tax=Bradyrhizobium sp. CCGE-LA001 TaxID=1223566 RepID=UPI0002AAA09D|nr:hypothetical protein [Bradyrhizobium sp. CCGE-LA001]AMA59859.1 hypothetical protein BCCGELA001_28765 [Bradyrhizobium sp. CCGE-LA001]